MKVFACPQCQWIGTEPLKGTDGRCPRCGDFCQNHSWFFFEIQKLYETIELYNDLMKRLEKYD